jgi:Fe-S-cluster containining protein
MPNKKTMRKSGIESLQSSLQVHFPGLDRLFEVYADLERRIAEFKERAGIDCLKKCQSCCSTAKVVEASIFEMLPLSLRLWEEGRGEEILARLEGIHPEDLCISLNLHPTEEAPEGCMNYSFRPLICRLFGFSATADKQGRPLIVICNPLKERHSGIDRRINERIREDLPVPLMADFSRRIAFLDPRLGREKYPVNIALWEALELVGQKIHLKKAAGEKG